MGGAKWWSSTRAASPNASPTRTSDSPCRRPIRPAPTTSSRTQAPASYTWTPETLPTRPLGRSSRCRSPDRAPEHPDVGDLLPRRSPLHLEHPARRLTRHVGRCGREQGRDPSHEVGDARAGHRGAGVHRVQQAARGLGGHRTVQPRHGRSGRPSTYAASRASSCSASTSVSRSRNVRSSGRYVVNVAARRAGPDDVPHRQHVGGEPAPDRVDDAVEVGADPVDLVHEHAASAPAGAGGPASGSGSVAGRPRPPTARGPRRRARRASAPPRR